MTDCYIDQQYFFLILAGLLNSGPLRAESPQSAIDSHFGILSPTDSNRPGHLVILFSNVHLLPLFFPLFTQVHLLIDGSVEGQYITQLRRTLNFKTEFNRFKFTIFFFLDWLSNKVKDASLPYYLPTAGGRIIGFIPSLRVLVLCKMQSASSRIWTRVAMSILFDDNHYTTGTSKPAICRLKI